MRWRDILWPWGALREARERSAGLEEALARDLEAYAEVDLLRAELDRLKRAEMLGLLDDVDSLVRFCSCNMPDVERYDIGAKAMWSVAHRLAGNDEIADQLAADVARLKSSAAPCNAPKRDAKTGRFVR